MTSNKDTDNENTASEPHNYVTKRRKGDGKTEVIGSTTCTCDIGHDHSQVLD